MLILEEIYPYVKEKPARAGMGQYPDDSAARLPGPPPTPPTPSKSHYATVSLPISVSRATGIQLTKSSLRRRVRAYRKTSGCTLTFTRGVAILLGSGH